eukprot:COSAG02_NODE_3145_length_7289_cov_10.121280_1_plen_58_part_10
MRPEQTERYVGGKQSSFAHHPFALNSVEFVFDHGYQFAVRLVPHSWTRGEDPAMREVN